MRFLTISIFSLLLTTYVSGQSCLDVSSFLVNVSCFGDMDGSINLTPNNGTPPYMFSLDNGITQQTFPTFSGLAAGCYDAYVVDNLGCAYTEAICITQPTEFFFPLPLDWKYVCNEGDAFSYDVQGLLSGGTPPYTYLWSNGTVGSSVSFTQSSATVTATDANGCKISNTISRDIKLDFAVVINNFPSCNGNIDGSASLVGTDWTGATSYQWSNGETGLTAFNLEAGDHSVFLIDDPDYPECTQLIEFTIEEPLPITLSAQITPENCTDNDGMISLTATGDSTAFDFIWSNGQTTETATGLALGWYSVTATDLFNGCSSHENFYVPGDLSCKAIVSGYVLKDAIAPDCTTDTGTTPLPNRMLILEDAGQFVAATFTDSLGYYELPTDVGTYVLRLVSQYVDDLLCPSTNSVVINASSINATYSQDFYLDILPQPELSINVVKGPARPGFMQNYTIHYQNNGSVGVNAMLNFTHDSLLINFDAGNTEQSYDPLTQTAIWDLGMVAPSASGQIPLVLQIPATTPINTILTTATSITPAIGDIDPSNNSSTCFQVVTGSFDPNDKQNLTSPNPFGGDIDVNTQTYHYKIRFQNTGTDTAFTVVIKDEIDANLDITSISPIASSHSYSMDFEDSNRLVFFFENIMLPDSNVNEPMSHGFIEFTIRPLPNLPLGTVISNEAAIYFDFNAPIITNVVENTLVDPPLPLEFIQFEAYYENKQVFLEWETLLEESNAHFEIERSVDGISFRKIGEQIGLGNSIATQQYEYIDKEAFSLPHTIFYYRLKQVDEDGYYSYSNILSIKLTKVDNELEISPNPFTNTVTIGLSNSSIQGNKIILTNSLGQIILVLDDFAPDEFVVNLSLSHLANGIYWIQVLGEDISFSQKVLKL